MADNLSRIEKDRKLFESTPRDQLLNLLNYGDNRQICEELINALDSLVPLEEFGLSKGVDPRDTELLNFKDSIREQIEKHVDIAITFFYQLSIIPRGISTIIH